MNEDITQNPPDQLNYTFDQPQIIQPKKMRGLFSWSSKGKIAATFVGIILLIIGVAAGVLLVQQQQEFRERASSGAECQQAQDCILLENPGNSGSFQSPNNIKYIFITNKNAYQYNPGSTNDGCYNVSITNKELVWERIGNGSDCKDISNIQVWTDQGELSDIYCEIISDNNPHLEIKITNNDSQTHSYQLQKCFCPGGELPCNSCDYSQPSIGANSVKTESHDLYDDCGSIQLDVNSVPDHGNFACYTIFTTSNPCITPTEPPSTNTPTPPEETPTIPPATSTPTPPISASCDILYAYTVEGNIGNPDNWTRLSKDDLSKLKAGDVVYFTVVVITDSGEFTKARFSINKTIRPDVTTLKPGEYPEDTKEFYDKYTIPEGVLDFSINAEGYHSILGWI